MSKNTVKGALPLPQALSPSSRGDSIFRTRLTSLEPRPAFPLLQSFSGLPALCPLGSAFCLRVPALILFCPLAVHQQDLAPLYPAPTLLTWRFLVCLCPAPRPPLHSPDSGLSPPLLPKASGHPPLYPICSSNFDYFCTYIMYSSLQCFNELGLWQYFWGYS